MTAPRLIPACLGLFAAAAASAAPASPVEFNRDIRVILSDNCLACHGPDPGARKAGLRLDTKEGLFGQTKDEGPVVKPGAPEESALWSRINQTDPDELMPPPESHKLLRPEDKDLFRRWIAEGAPWQPHWAFIPPVRPPLPSAAPTHGNSQKAEGKGDGDEAEIRNQKSEVQNPIDAFVIAKLATKGMMMNPEADRRTLVRRLALDLTGLPPEPAEVEAAVADPSADWYDKVVTRYMDSPRWGEHRGRYWLDAARYADTHGLHFDNYREMWPYRDWVIEAFNRNQPFDQFVVEQLAGDLLEDPTLDQLVATGFQRCNITTNEGGTIEEENLANYANDRVSTVGWVFLGLTMTCSACHDHKFDPVSQRDFYSMAAFFRNTTQNGFDGNTKDGRAENGTLIVPQGAADRARWAALPDEIAAATNALASGEAAALAGLDAWAKSVPAAELTPWVSLPGEYVRVPLTEGSGTNVTLATSGGTNSLAASGPLSWRADGPLGPAPVLGKDAVITLGDLADFDERTVFSFGAWVRVPEGEAEGSIISRMSSEADHFRGWDLFAGRDEFVVHLVHRWAPDSIKVNTTDKALKRGQWQHVMVTYAGTGASRGVAIHVDGEKAAVNGDRDNLAGPIRTPARLRLGGREGMPGFDRLAVQDVRIYGRRLAAHEIRALAAAPGLPMLLARSGETNREPLNRALGSYFLVTRDSNWQAAQHQLAALEFEMDGIRARSPVTHVQVEKQDSRPVAKILFRGQYDQPRDEVAAATPAALHAFPAGAPTNRLGLARWMISPENPLLARVTVNRFWQELFGTGLVRTSEDFGIMGENPANPELLDWLAVEFRESGWDVKRFFRLLATSAAYKQEAAVTPEKLDRDPANRLLSRGPRFRMDAEMVRDYALASGGLLDARIGGASARTYQPEGVWEAVAMPESNTRHYRADQGEGLYRRSLYSFWKRAAPPALMEVLNAPNREVACTRRERTNTPLQALATLNDPQFVEAALHLAQAALRRHPADPDAALGHLAERLLARPLSPEEMAIVRATLADMQAYYAQSPGDVARLLGVGQGGLDAPARPGDLAAFTMVANQLLNLDEALNK